MRKILISLFVLIAFLNIVLAQQISVSLGPEEIVFDWTSQKCDNEDIPDLPARAFRDSSNNIQLISTHFNNRRFVGSNLNNVIRSCNPIFTSSLDPNPSQYNDHEWLTSTYTFDGQTIYALIHNEYHGYQYNSCNSYTSCWYNAITSAISTNAGATYTQVAPPGHLVASVPYPYINNFGTPYGYFGPSNIIQKDGYYYSFLQVESYQNQQAGACLMRTNNLADSTSWRFWNGNSFNNIPINPYTTTITNINNHLCSPIPQIGKIVNSVTWNNYLNKYILVGVHQTSSSTSDSGFFYSLSDDLINWGPPQLIMTAILPWMPESAGIGGGQYQLYPSLIQETSSRNFEITGQSPYMYYTKKNSNVAEPSLDRDLVRRQITFSLVDITNPSIVPNLNVQAISSNSLQVYWGAATDNVAVTGYLVDISTSPSFVNYVTGWNSNNIGNTLNIVVPSLSPNTLYYLRVRARDAAGNLGAYSQTVSISTLQQSAPFNFGLSWSNPTSVSQGNVFPISVTANLISGSPQPVTFGLSNLPLGTTFMAVPLSCTVSCSATLLLTTSQNTPLQTHNLNILVQGGGVNLSLPINVIVTPLTDKISPSMTPDLNLFALDHDSLQISWGAATDNVAVTGYLVDISTSPSFVNYVTGWFNRDSGNQLNILADGLNPETIYYVRVRARDAAGNLGAYSTVKEVFTLQNLLISPTIPIFAQVYYDSENNFVKLSWADSLYEQSYSIERAIDEGDFIFVSNVLGDTTEYIDSSVNINTNYIYRIKAINSAGESPYNFWSLQTQKSLVENKEKKIEDSSGELVINSPIREFSGNKEYSWAGSPDKIKIILQDFVSLHTLEIEPYYNSNTILSKKAIVSSYGDLNELPQEIKEDYRILEFFAIDLDSFEGEIYVDLKINNYEKNEPTLFVKMSDSSWEKRELVLQKEDESYKYYNTVNSVPVAGRYVLGITNRPYRSEWKIYLILGILFIFIIGLIFKLKKIFSKN